MSHAPAEARLPWSVRIDRALVGLTAACGLVSLVSYPRGLGLLIVLGFGLAAIGLWRPRIGLYGVALLCTLDAPTRIFLLTGGLLRWNTLNYWLLGVAALSLPHLLRLRDVHSRLLGIFVALLVVWLVPTTSMELGMQHVVNVACTFGIIAYAITGGTSPGAWRTVAWMCGTAGTLGGLGYYLNAAALPYANPNAWALAPLSTVLAICLGYVHARSAREHLLLGALAAMNLVWVFLSGSRGGMLGGLLGAAFLFAATPGLSRRLVAATLVALLALGISLQFGDLQATALHRISRLLESSSSLSSRTSGRADLALGGWYIFLDHPLGVGTGGFAHAWAELGPREGLSGFEQGKVFPAHAGWIKTLAENGVPGITLLLGLLASLGLAGLATRDPRVRLVAFLTPMVLGVAWITTEFQAKGLWFLLAGAIALLGGWIRLPPRHAPGLHDS